MALCLFGNTCGSHVMSEVIYFPDKLKIHTQLETGLCPKADLSLFSFVIFALSTAWHIGSSQWLLCNVD